MLFIKKYLNLFLIVSTVLLFITSNWFSFSAGINKERAADAKAIAVYQNKVSKLVDQLEKEKLKREGVTHEKVIIVKQVKSKCADAVIDQSILDQLR